MTETPLPVDLRAAVDRHLAEDAARTAETVRQLASLDAQVGDLQRQLEDARAQVPPTPAPESGRYVDAHYMPNMPIGIDSTPTAEPTQTYWWRNYINPLGEGGRHASYGGFTRDMPAGPYATTGDWKATNYATEIAQARAAGIDGFLINLMSLAGQNWDRATLLSKTAAADGAFRATPNLDCSRAASIDEQDPVVVADRLALLYQLGAARMIDGRTLLSSFTAETCTVDWWRRLRAALEAKVGPVHLAIGLQNASDANLAAYAPVADTLGYWGVSRAAGSGTGPDLAAKAHALGKKWMAPVRPQDVRHRDSTYAEPENTTLFRNLWARVIETGADCVQVITWNDYAESSQVAPSRNNRGAWGALNLHYATWFKAGAELLARDQIVLTHRTQAAATLGTTPGLLPMKPTLGGANTPRDNAEAVVLATAPGVVELRSGDATVSRDVVAGLNVVAAPLRPGVVTASLRRGSSTLTVTSPDKVVTAPAVQDLTYHAVTVSP